MYLKALEIQGFKSFPDKVRLSFEKEVTAIVGPNGSGKSNISDAISWVLGEQRSKALRGSKMEDVIFGGTPERTRLGFAQVSLILDNSTGAFDAREGELSVTRRYYRSGESEYFINKKTVRLKDVNSLFMDTGLGRDGYSMIGQGRVDEILSAKSTDRREVFEEAAGISRFRYRREEAQNKLNKTEESLVRINDKISELEMNVEPLRKQAEVAKRYLTLRDELRGLEISLWLESLDRLAEKTVALREEYEDAGSRLEKAKAGLQEIYDKAESFEEKLREKDEEAEKLRREIAAVNAAQAEKDSEAAVLSANISSNEETAERLGEELKAQNERNAGLNEQIAQHRLRAEEIEIEIAELSQRCGEIIDKVGIKELELKEKSEALESVLKEISITAGAAAAAQARLEALSASGEEMQSRTESVKTELERFDERLNAEIAAMGKCASELEKKQEEAQEAENRISGLAKKAENRAKISEELIERRNEVRMEESKAASRASLLSDMKKEYEGFSRAVRTVMQEARAGGLKGIHGTVAELIKVSDDYSVAIETALNDSVQNIVVDREEDGKAGISLLKRRDAGRATFLPISSIHGNELRELSILSEPGIIDIASRLVDCDTRYDGIIRNLLGRTVIAENLDYAIAAARNSSSRVKIVTLDGQVMNVGGSMTGGSAARSVGIISRANELERVLEKAEKCRRDIKKLSEQIEEAQRGEAEARYAKETADTELRELQDTLLKLKTELDQRKILTESLKATRASMEAGLDETVSNAGRNKREIEKVGSILAEQREKELQLKELADKAEKERASSQKLSEELSQSLSEMKNNEAALKSERDTVLRAAADWESLAASLSEENRNKADEIASIKEKNAQLLEDRERITAQAESFKLLAEEGKRKLDAVRKEKSEIESSRSSNQKQLQEINNEIIELERAYAKIEQRKQAADMEEKQLVDKLWDTYELSRSAAQRQRQELDSIPKANRRANEIKKEIASLGTPNIGAIEEFERVNERYTYLTDQRDDILNAKTGLEKIIRDVTKEMEEIFLREFKSINEHFKVTFKELFGGGNASLELEDENAVLTCGVEIKVQPPGKTQKTLTLLSGGERAFVAIALYFAIMKVRPTPFCVLDEIESALDEKNVARFADYLRKVCDRTQFLVITHRRGSMERADVLYGVTMQKGVSKVLSIDLNEALDKY